MVKEIIDEYKEGIYKSFDEAQRFLFHELEQELIEKTYLGIHKDMSKEEIKEKGILPRVRNIERRGCCLVGGTVR